ncbi:DUF3859 domain-containing protein [Fulvivirga maritima]|uniref:DUF3859 domain-containing protein n=1 Tax=Fulvivirga maritima TaxID=2904247 RepID=UPI001F2871D9|nr:DUF3859 domain-containing protein [Fulvivirga maritima]UII28935.1 DUF3859 domain-containing protein [Fulvivirga maritima]
MAFEEKTPKYIIHYSPNDVTSIRDGLTTYGELVESEKAFSSDYCVVVFKPEVEAIPLSFFKDHPAIMKFLDEAIYPCEEEEKEDLTTNTLTETLFFACALMHPELEEDIKKTCEKFVDFSRLINDSAEMWITVESPFAISPLKLTATVYPKYGYLMAGFLIPYWDDEHMMEPLFELDNWARPLGITEDTLKAFCYCDNSMARSYMLGYDVYNGQVPEDAIGSHFDLISFFREKESNYQLFKDLLVERFQNQSFLQHTDDIRYVITNPIEHMVQEMMVLHYPYDSWDDDFDIDEYLTQKLVNKSAEEEIAELKAYVEERLGKPIVSTSEPPQAGRQGKKEVSKPEQPLTKWETFIKKGFAYGEPLWSYIEEGTDPSILKAIKHRDIFQRAEEASFDILEDFEEVGYSLSSMWTDLEFLFNPLIKRYKKWCSQNGIEAEECHAILLRLIEVIFHLNGKAPFPPTVKDCLVFDRKICSKEEYETRYATDWLVELETKLNSFVSRKSTVTQEFLHECYKLIRDNRKEANEKLPEKLFVAPAPFNEDDDDNYTSTQQYGTEEVSVIAAYIIHRESENTESTNMVSAAADYLNKHTVDAIISDLYHDTEFPQQYIIDMLQSDQPNTLTESHKKEARALIPVMSAFSDYIKTGVYIQNGKKLSLKASENAAFESIKKHLKYDDHEISGKQKNIEWLRNFSDKTQKLLYTAHIGAQHEELACTDALGRLLKLAFHLAPVRVVNLLSKAYKTHEYRLDHSGNMLNMLELFTPQGLSDAGYWGYLIDEYAGDADPNRNDHYKLLLTEWVDRKKPAPSNHFLASTIQEQRKALDEGVLLLPRDTQLKVLNDAAKAFPEDDFTRDYDNLLTDLISRQLKKEFVVEHPAIYFKNRLQSESIYFEYIEWDKWGGHPDLVHQILNEIEISKPEDLADENHAEQVINLKEWGHLVLQKQGNKLVPVYGKDLLWLIQKGFNAENIHQARTKLIIIDTSCPQANYEELIEFSNSDFSAHVLRQALGYLMGFTPQEQAEKFIRHGINNYWFLNGMKNYYDITISELILKTKFQLQMATFRMLGMISYKHLQMDLGIQDSAYFDMLMSMNVDRKAIFKKLVSENNISFINNLAKRTDIRAYVLEEKIATQLPLLSSLVHLPGYHAFILSLANSESLKLKDHVQMLIERYKLKPDTNTAFHIVDYGVYVMGGNTDPESGSTNKTATEPECTNQTTEINAEVGMYFGFRFTATDPENAPKVLVHDVKVKHPTIDPETKEIKYQTSGWQQNGYSNSNIFLGWFFETEEELIPGEYQFTALDTDGNILAEKSFSVS